MYFTNWAVAASDSFCPGKPPLGRYFAVIIHGNVSSKNFPSLEINVMSTNLSHRVTETVVRELHIASDFQGDQSCAGGHFIKNPTRFDVVPVANRRKNKLILPHIDASFAMELLK